MPTPPLSPNGLSTVAHKGPERYRHPAHLLKHQFLPCGTLIREPSPKQVAKMEIDPKTTSSVTAKNEKLSQESSNEKKSPKTKKRKNDDDSPKKSKKLKATVYSAHN